MSDKNLLSKSAQRVQEALWAKEAAFEIQELSASTRTAHEAAAALRCEVAQIVKSLLFRTVQTDVPILVLASGINRVNEKKLAELVGENIVKADADFARKITGYAIGGIPPIGHICAISHIYIDEELLQFETLWAAAGTPHAVFSLSAEAMIDLTGGRVVPVK